MSHKLTDQPPRRRGPAGTMVATCDCICRIAMLLMIAIVATEVFARSVLAMSLQLSDELGGYLLVTISFLSLPVCQSAGGFHQVTFVHARLPPRGRAAL
jgi:TRAP-type C4-dicarboxylate transport system permease small subunit